MSSQLLHRHSAIVPNIEQGRMPSQLYHRHSALVPNIELGLCRASSDIDIRQKSRISSWGECLTSSDIDILH
ncbi:hypothetical protein DPMN_039714 [Dreissena polymorpha]|uniref:Uncharacterized protein n=1 Tax=Dreissena polymorpha TaxID=45954 RepID=A0A9D4CVB0_DREPO|nr:hypothetical protein DPMN_039714 [Dreissena polymorpha]